MIVFLLILVYFKYFEFLFLRLVIEYEELNGRIFEIYEMVVFLGEVIIGIVKVLLVN